MRNPVPSNLLHNFWTVSMKKKCLNICSMGDSILRIQNIIINENNQALEFGKSNLYARVRGREQNGKYEIWNDSLTNARGDLCMCVFTSSSWIERAWVRILFSLDLVTLVGSAFRKQINIFTKNIHFSLKKRRFCHFFALFND